MKWRSLNIVLLATAPGLASHWAMAEPFSLETVRVALPESGVALQIVLRAGPHEFQFQPPAGWRIAIDTNASQITWTAPDQISTLRLRIETSSTAPVGRIAVEKLRSRVAEQWRNAHILEEFTCYTSGREGRAFDFEYSPDERARVSARLGFIALPRGLVEFALTAPPDQFTSRQVDFTSLLSSFRVDEMR